MANWGYKAENGPHTWAELYEEARGPRQSPINIPTHQVSLDPKLSSKQLTWNWPDKTLDVTNTGYGWKAHVHGEESCLQGGPLKDKYRLEQYHMHWGPDDSTGSEHLVDGQTYAGEIHFVHWNTKYGSFGEAVKHGDGLAVLGVFVEVGKENSEMEALIRALPKIQYRNEISPFTEPLNPAKLLPGNRAYWTYLGSLTTPPCSECVIWIVFKEPIQMSHEQLEALRFMSSLPKDECTSVDKDECIIQNYRPPLPKGERFIRASYN